MIQLREITKKDAKQIHLAFAAQGWQKPILQFERYWQEQDSGYRSVILAEWDHEFAGYLTIKWQSDYPAFQEQNIPEVVDFNVLKKFQRLKIGSQLMDEAEKKVSNTIGLGFGLTEDYGAAQVLYIKRGYIPNGSGLMKDNRSIKLGETILVDHSLVLYLQKRL